MRGPQLRRRPANTAVSADRPVPVPSSGSAGPAPKAGARRGGSVGRTRVGGWWVALVAAAVVLLLLLIFVLQNGQRVSVSFLGASGRLPLGIALLLAATAGVLIVAIPGSGRILQLRHLARQQAHQPPQRPSADQPGDQPADQGGSGSPRSVAPPAPPGEPATAPWQRADGEEPPAAGSSGSPTRQQP